MGLGDFYGGEKKKKKKGGNAPKPMGIAPVFTPPTITPKGKNKF